MNSVEQYRSIQKDFNQGNWNRILELFQPEQDTSIIKENLRVMVYYYLILLARNETNIVITETVKLLEMASKIKNHVAVLGLLYIRLYTCVQTSQFEDFEIELQKHSKLVEAIHIEDHSTNNILEKEWISSIYAVRGIKEAYTGNYSNGIELANEGLRLARDIDFHYGIAFCNYALSFCYRNQENVKIGLQYAKECIEISQKHNFKIILCLIYLNIAVLYRIKGDNDNFINYSTQALNIGKELELKLATDYITGEIGQKYMLEGDYEEAVESFLQGIKLAKQRNDNWVIAHRYYDLGQIYRNRGELNTSLEMFNLGLDASNKIKNKFISARALHAVGTIYYDQGDFESAENNLKQAHEMVSVSSPKSVSRSIILHSLVQIAIETNNTTKLNEYLKEFDRIVSDEQEKIPETIEVNYLLAKASYLNSSIKLRDKLAAQDLYKEISDRKEIDYQTQIIVTFNLCESIIYEYKITGDAELVPQIEEYIDNLYTIGSQNHVYPVIIRALVLKAKLSLVSGTLETAKASLKEARIIARNKKLVTLEQKIEMEEQHIANTIEEWQSLLSKNASVKDRVEKAEMETYLKAVLQLVEQPQFKQES